MEEPMMTRRNEFRMRRTTIMAAAITASLMTFGACAADGASSTAGFT